MNPQDTQIAKGEESFEALQVPHGGAMIHFIGDYAPGDLAVSEVMQAIYKEVPLYYREQVTSVESFNTIETGFIIGQLGLQDESLRPVNMIIFANCAPRTDVSDKARVDNEGEGLVYGILNNGVKILAVNSEFSLSFVREDFAQLYGINVGKSGSQFRSRDYYPAVVGRVARGDKIDDIVGAKLDPSEVIRDLPESRIGYIDSFGNIKTTLRVSDERFKNLQPGQRFPVEINGIRRAVTVATGSFNVKEGDFAFAPGSSGHEDRFWEIFQRRGSAREGFKKPRVGAPIELALPEQ